MRPATLSPNSKSSGAPRRAGASHRSAARLLEKTRRRSNRLALPRSPTVELQRILQRARCAGERLISLYRFGTQQAARPCRASAGPTVEGRDAAIAIVRRRCGGARGRNNEQEYEAGLVRRHRADPKASPSMFIPKPTRAAVLPEPVRPEHHRASGRKSFSCHRSHPSKPVSR